MPRIAGVDDASGVEAMTASAGADVGVNVMGATGEGMVVGVMVENPEETECAARDRGLCNDGGAGLANAERRQIADAHVTDTATKRDGARIELGRHAATRDTGGHEIPRHGE